MKKGQRTEILEVEKLDRDGRGLVNTLDLVLLIDGAAPGDRVVASVDHISEHRPTAWCSVQEVVSRGDSFVRPKCPVQWPVLGGCGGCPAMHLTEATQAQMKRSFVTEELINQNIDVSVSWNPSPIALGYRNRGQFVPSLDEDGNPVLGSYSPRSHRVVSMNDCAVLQPPIPRVAGQIQRLITKQGIPIHPQPLGLRYVTIRASVHGDALVDIVVLDKDATWVAGFVESIMSIEQAVGVSMSQNTTEGNSIRTSSSVTLFGDETVEEPIGDIVLRMAASSFSQLNTQVAQTMYEAAKEWSKSNGVIWDLYCGLGGLGISVAHKRPDTRVYGADSVKDAIELAHLNAVANDVNAEYMTADLANGIPVDWPEPKLVLVNPPRRGLDNAVVERLAECSGKLIIYMSCNPSSFCKDARKLIDSGKTLMAVSAHDMLPQTTHVELLALFE